MQGKGGDILNKKILVIALVILVVSGAGAIFMTAGVIAPARPQVYGKYNFVVEIDGIAQAGFREVEGLNATVEVWEYREGTEQTTVRLEPGVARYGPLVLRWGVTQNAELWSWMEQTLQGNIERKNISVIILNQKREEVVRYNLEDAWPSSFNVDTLDSQDSGPAIEELVIQYEGLDRVGSLD